MCIGLGIASNAILILVQIERAELVIVNVGATLETIARATVRTHGFLLVHDIEEDTWMSGPQRHVRIRAVCGKILRRKLDRGGVSGDGRLARWPVRIT
jgi:hypothetical protein